jgi:decaprenylphospho-beta-D-ribofuranose 2-oxidase
MAADHVRHPQHSLVPVPASEDLMADLSGSRVALDWHEEYVRGWGMAVGGQSRVLRPTTAEQIVDAFESARKRGSSVALRGAGCSYGDAAINTGGHVLDLSQMRRILSFDPLGGIARVEPGVTIRDLWRHAITFGYWPKVVSGTMAVSIGGAAAMNIHGKNNFAVGSFGECIRSFTLLTPSGQTVRCTRDSDPELFHSAISGFGMLGCFTELELELKRVHSGRLKVSAIVARDLEHNLQILEDMRGEADYLVSWLDLHAKGAELGRGVMHRADQMVPGEDPDGLRYFDPLLQDVPDRLFGVVPKGWLWPGMWTAVKLGQVGLVNALKMRAGPGEARRSPYLQSHGAFHFLLDYVPRWQWMTKPGGLIQFQPFVPKEHGERVLRLLIEECQKASMVPYLGVLKRHRPDPFLMTHAVDGYSLAMDFAVSTSQARREQLWQLCQRLAEHVLDAGGRFYYAKDAVLQESSFARVHGQEAVARFRSQKQKWDPERLLQTDLARRLGV